MNSEIKDILEKLKKELQNPLPGQTVHQQMLSPDLIPEPLSADIKTRKGSVLLLLFPVDEKLNIVLIRRPSSMKYHAGQIAFPGGGFEPADRDLKATAIRETTEELGIDGDQFEIIGELSPVHVVVSNYTVNAYIGWSASNPSFNFNKGEVDAIFSIPLQNLTDRGVIQYQEVETHLGKRKFPGYYANGIFIWGATAMILTEFLEVYKKVI